MRRRWFLKSLAAWAMATRRVAAAQDQVAVVRDVECAVVGDRARVVLTLDEPCQVEVEEEAARVRVWPAVYLPVEDGRVLPRGPVREYWVRSSLEGDFVVWVELQTAQGASLKAWTVDRPPRVVVEVAGAPPTPAAGRAWGDLEARAREELARLQELERTGSLGFKITTVVVDPGHGGHDPGAVGPGGTKEKDVTLAIARRLSQALRDAGIPKVILTRTDDYFVNLSHRTALANGLGADVFVSIHCNAFRDTRAAGTETFFCAQKPSSAEAARVAAFENSFAEPGEMTAQESILDVEWVLFRLQRHLVWKDASRVAQVVHRGLVRALSLRDRGVHSADFFVLRKAQMPSLLVETAFLSNPEEERVLRLAETHEALARTLADSLRACSS